MQCSSLSIVGLNFLFVLTFIIREELLQPDLTDCGTASGLI